MRPDWVAALLQGCWGNCYYYCYYHCLLLHCFRCSSPQTAHAAGPPGPVQGTERGLGMGTNSLALGSAFSQLEMIRRVRRGHPELKELG